MKVTQNALLQKELNRIDIRVLDMGYAKLDNHWHATMAKWTSSRIYMICSGSAMLRYGEQEIRMLPGNIYMVPPSVATDYWCDDAAEKFYYHINVVKYNYYDLFSGYPDCIILENRQQDIDKISRLWFENSIQSALALKEQLYRIVLDALEQAGIDSGKVEVYSSFIKGAIRYIERNLSANLTVEQIATNLQISKFRLQKDFSREVGVPLRKYINDRLMYAAESLLRQQDCSIKSVSERLGFCDQFYFSRRFRQRFGISPAKYRKNIKLK